MDKKEIGARLRRLRGNRSLARVARDLGCTPMTVWYWEAGIRMPRDEMKIKIAAYFKKSVAGLFYKE